MTKYSPTGVGVLDAPVAPGARNSTLPNFRTVTECCERSTCTCTRVSSRFKPRSSDPALAPGPRVGELDEPPATVARHGLDPRDDRDPVVLGARGDDADLSSARTRASVGGERVRHVHEDVDPTADALGGTRDLDGVGADRRRPAASKPRGRAVADDRAATEARSRSMGAPRPPARRPCWPPSA